MRNERFKFRAWMIESSKMVQWHRDMFYDTSEVTNYGGSFPPDDEDTIIMQWIGLKDKNGVDIYEDDIVMYRNIKCKVFYQFASFRIAPLSNVDISVINTNTEIEVIGNIYETPELLK